MTMHQSLAAVAVFLGGSAAMVDFRSNANPSEFATEIEKEADHIDALTLAERLRDSAGSLLILDLRSRGEFREFHIPGARQTSIADLTIANLPRDKSIILYSEGGGHAAQAWVLLRMRGYRNVFFLREGIYEWVSRLDRPSLAIDATEAERVEFARASKLSRFFGGTPQSGIRRSEVPTGYWTDRESPESGTASSTNTAPNARIKVRRRGC